MKFLPSGLVLNFPFCGVKDFSSKGNDLTVPNGIDAPTFQPNFLGSSNRNKALHFPTDIQRYYQFGSSGIPIGSSPRTVAAWGYHLNYGESTYSWIIAWGGRDGGQNGQYHACFIGRRGTTSYFGGYSDDISAANSFPVNTWVFLVGTYDSNKDARLYIDGELKAGPTNKPNWDTLSTNFLISNQANFEGEVWWGDISNIMIWNRALSSDEILNVYRRTRGKFYS